VGHEVLLDAQAGRVDCKADAAESINERFFGDIIVQAHQILTRTWMPMVIS
jgi:hypothetical protein